MSETELPHTKAEPLHLSGAMQRPVAATIMRPRLRRARRGNRRSRRRRRSRAGPWGLDNVMQVPHAVLGVVETRHFPCRRAAWSTPRLTRGCPRRGTVQRRAARCREKGSRRRLRRCRRTCARPCGALQRRPASRRDDRGEAVIGHGGAVAPDPGRAAALRGHHMWLPSSTGVARRQQATVVPSLFSRAGWQPPAAPSA